METLEYEDLRLAYKPFLRPPGLEARLRDAFRLDARFTEEYPGLRHLLLARRETFADDMLRFLTTHDAIDSRFAVRDMTLCRRLAEAHLRNILPGKFGDTYLSGLEDLALLLARHNTSMLWIDAAYHDLSLSFMDQIVTHQAMTNPILRRGAYRSLATWIMLETSQFRRVFCEYARLLRHEAGPDPDAPPPDAADFSERLRRISAGLLRPD
ncbi:hypothetical protein FDP22_02630 [Paroceanicella profunda]|uniref:Globin-sensor domain-containing protein n=1 Tax=Paroceanicella profunda TaxID=2579971 RepID=A0A5B8FUN3_9RHOB|nr:hypothetical protein [Paroceanicella profunda]QDL90780.1 hypothetical protein FDP22_02630 [Paroceanicella profunda]